MCSGAHRVIGTSITMRGLAIGISPASDPSDASLVAQLALQMSYILAAH